MKRSRFFEFIRIVIALLCVSTLLCACTQGGEGFETEAATTKVDETTKNEENSTEDENDTTEKEEETSDSMKAPELTSTVTERYFIFRIWNFTIMSYETFKYTVDEAVKSGFNAIKVHIPWALVQPDANTLNFSEFDKMVDYVVNEKGLKVAISVDLTRRETDALVGNEHIQRDINGNLCVGGSHGADRTVISFCSDYAVDLAIDFYKTTVEHYENLYGNDILFYLPAFNPYCETEYWAAAEYDYSDLALAAFTEFLENEYGNVDKLNTVLGTDYAEFDAVVPPSCTKSDGLGQLWYRFRHEKLKSFIDGLAMAQKSVAPNSEFSIQIGCVFDEAAAIRCTLAFTDLCEKVDVLWVDDGPLTDHYWSMDYIRASLDGRVKLAQEIDGPYQNQASVENYLNQGLTAYHRGATYVSAANWSIDDNYSAYESVWQQISSTWLGEDHPDVVTTVENTQVLEVSLLNRFKRGSSAVDMAKYHELSGDENDFVYIRIVDDLSDVKVDTFLPYSAFPSDFSSTQGEGGWYYRSYKKGNFSDMTFSDGMWHGRSTYTLVMNGSMHPDEYDAAIVFKAVKDGTIEYCYSLSLRSNESDGIEYTVLVNGKPTAELGEDFIYLPYGEIAEGSLLLQVKQGDEIAIIVNRHKTTTSDTTAVTVTAEYKS